MTSKKRPLQSPDEEGDKKRQKVDVAEEKKEETKKEKTPSELIDEFLANNPIPQEDLAVKDDSRLPTEVYGLVRRQEVHMVREFEDVQLFEFENIKCSGAPVIMSFPSIGMVGVLSGRQMVKTLNLPQIGVLKLGNALRAACVVSHEQPSYPARVYGNEHLVVFICEMNVRVPDEVVENLVECVFDFAHRHRSPMIYVLEGIPKPHVVQLPTGEEVVVRLGQREHECEEDEEDESDNEDEMIIDDSFLAKLTVRQRVAETGSTKADQTSSSTTSTSDSKPENTEEETKQTKPSKRRRARSQSLTGDFEEDDKQFRIAKLSDKLFADKIHYVTTNVELAKKLRGLGHIPVVDGLITGFTGGLLAEAPLKTRDVAAILAPGSTLFPDPDSAISVLKLLDSVLPGIGMGRVAEELEKDVASLKKMMKGLMQKVQSKIQTGGPLRRSGGNVPQGMYQ